MRVAIFSASAASWTLEAGTTHLQLLSKTAVLLMNEGFRSSVQDAADAEKIATLINEGLDEE